MSKRRRLIRHKQLANVPHEITVTSKPFSSDWLIRGSAPLRYYVAVSKYGFGCDTDIEQAILAAQDHVPLKDKPSQLCIYAADTPCTPVAVGQWRNGEHPKLVGLTNTHQVWVKNMNMIW